MFQETRFFFTSVYIAIWWSDYVLVCGKEKKKEWFLHQIYDEYIHLLVCRKRGWLWYLEPAQVITSVIASIRTMLLWGSRDLADYRLIPCNFFFFQNFRENLEYCWNCKVIHPKTARQTFACNQTKTDHKYINKLAISWWNNKQNMFISLSKYSTILHTIYIYSSVIEEHVMSNFSFRLTEIFPCNRQFCMDLHSILY